MNYLELLGELVELLGAILIAYAALAVNYRFRHEHKIDEVVFREMRQEHVLGIIGILLLIAGFVLKAFGRIYL